MKKIISLFIVILSFTLSGYSQDSFTVNGLTEGKQWQIIEKALYDNGYEIGEFIPTENVIYTNWIQWNSIAIQNRGLIEVKLTGQKATISMVKRSYKTEKGWEDAFGKLSKKNKKKYLLNLSTKISEIIASEKMTTDAVQNSILFPVFKSVNTVLGIEFTLNSVYQDLESNDKPLAISFTLKNNSGVVAKMEINFWGSQNIFLGVPVKMENYNLKGKAGYSKFIGELKPNETATYSAYYKCSGVITKIPKYKHLIHVNGKRKDLIIHDIILPYYNKNVEKQ